MGERGIARAEVVERDQDVHVVQAGKRLGHPIGAAVEERPLRDLDAEM